MMHDLAVVGAGVLGCCTAYQAIRSHPDWRVLLLERSAIGAGATGWSAGVSFPLAATARHRELVRASAAEYAALPATAKRFLRPVRMIYVVSGERLAALRDRVVDAELREVSGDERHRVTRMLPDLRLGADERLLTHDGAGFAVDAKQFSEALVAERVEVRLGAQVETVESLGDAFRLATGRAEWLARRVVVASGPWSVPTPLPDPPGARRKRIAAVHAALPVVAGDPLVYFVDDDLFLLPMSAGSALVSYYRDEWDTDPATVDGVANRADLTLGTEALRRRSPAAAAAVTGGRAFCDLYTDARLPVVVSDPGIPGLAAIRGGSGSGVRLAPALAGEALRAVGSSPPKEAPVTTSSTGPGFGARPVFVFSTPPTPNGDLHLGHLSGPYLGADAFVRFQRMNGTAAWHLTGSDDFQSYVVECARREGRTPADTAAHYSAEIAETLRLMDIEPDQYTVTNADPGYPKGLQAFFSRLVESGSVAPRPAPALFEGLSGAYLYETWVSGRCPTCGEPTGGNICEECGEPNSCADLVDPVANRSDIPPEPGTVARFSLPLHEFRAEVAAHHRAGRVPARLRELAERLFARDRLDIAVSHPSDWGVPPIESDVDGQVIWVWPEMAYGFLHGIAALGRRTGRSWDAAQPRPDWKIVHFFGYDNSFYHAILYPVLYRLAFPDLTLDIDYHVNEFYLLDGAKFSTSRQHAIWGKEILGPQSVDAVRFYLSRTRPEGRRTNFERAAYEAELGDVLIGTWQRWLTDLGDRVTRHCAGRAPETPARTAEQNAFLGRLEVRLAALTNSLGAEGFSLNRAAAELHGIVEDTVSFARLEGAVADSAAWRDETRAAIGLELAAARLLARCATPVMPRFAARLAGALGDPPPAVWPDRVDPVSAGTAVHLSGQVFFVADPPESTPLPWLRALVRETLQLAEDAAVDERTLTELGAGSLQAVAVQFQILRHTDVDLPLPELLGTNVAGLAGILEQRVAAEGVTV
ncbi:MAG TPA: FAD-dependent oxidoreductase [Actinophytocola sp.]|uniref:FAD-dependent oxidoreductase n=1 Tax=Actinophytocola sp. TaxID=1872138 RepID=UPI002DBA1454|nr:FAD-dependent oxidoreductase [Actinophytocola sp.]HEU5470233.1 FAD-dependent oxidoreductase [Actinophytocola sp.]